MIAALFALAMGALSGALAHALLSRPRRHDAAPLPVEIPPRAPLPSVHRVPIPYPRPLCARCGRKITVEHEGDECLLEATPERLRYYHLDASACGRASPAA